MQIETLEDLTRRILGDAWKYYSTPDHIRDSETSFTMSISALIQEYLSHSMLAMRAKVAQSVENRKWAIEQAVQSGATNFIGNAEDILKFIEKE